MSVYSQWLAATIAAGASTSAAVDLGASYDFLLLQIPPMDTCKLYLQVAEKVGDTYYNLGKDVTTDEEDFGRADVWKLGGFNFIKVVATTTQIAERLIRVKGMRY